MAIDQPVMSIAGIPEDPVFVHISYVASSLSEMLPSFQFERISKQREEWELWLKEFCKAHDWTHESSPLVWRKVGLHADNATYVGGATQFWEFIHEYYGIESRLTKDELDALKQDFVQEFEVEARIAASKAMQRKLNFTVYGGDKSLRKNLAVELFSIEKLQLGNGITVKLYNPTPHNTEVSEQMKDMDEIRKGLHAATVVQNISAALANCDVLIVLDEILRQNEETTDHWLNRNRDSMLELSLQINDYATDRMKVIFCSAGPTCFNAGVLAESTTKLDTNNIVSVDAQKCFEIFYELLDSSGVPLEEIGCPPVWGFLGINQFVDVCNAVQNHEIYRPNNRALRPHESTTLSLGTRQAELRSIFYAMHDKKPRVMSNSVQIEYIEEFDYQATAIRECNAICDLLRLWYDESCNNEGAIISLGICSNGTFGIPERLFFSQPVYLKDREDGPRVWVPCSEFPTPNHPSWIFKNLIETAQILAEKLIYRKNEGKTSQGNP